MTVIHVRIVTHEGIYDEFDTDILNVQTLDGDRGILANHMPLVTMLKVGWLSANINNQRVVFAISGGLLYFRENNAEILTDAIERQADIDVDRAKKAQQRAEQRISSNDPNIDIKRAEVALRKAINRIKVANMKQ